MAREAPIPSILKMQDLQDFQRRRCVAQATRCGRRNAVKLLDDGGLLLTHLENERALPVPENTGRRVLYKTYRTVAVGGVEGACSLGGQMFVLYKTKMIRRRPVKDSRRRVGLYCI
jgi:hypothetical protein